MKPSHLIRDQTEFSTASQQNAGNDFELVLNIAIYAHYNMVTREQIQFIERNYH